MQAILILLAIASVPLLMWLMVRQRRKVDAKMRTLREAREQEERALSRGPRYEDVKEGADGLGYGHRSDPAEDMLPSPDDGGGEVGGVKAMQGRR